MALSKKHFMALCGDRCATLFSTAEKSKPAEYGHILHLNPNYPQAHYHLGQAYEHKRQA
jgi:hypothetical protein